MKAIRIHEFGGPEKLKLEQVADPKPGPGQVVIKIKAVGVNPVETYIRTGTYAIKPNLPYTPGADGAGEVVSVGEGVTKFKPGDRVYTVGSVTGTYAEQALCTEVQVHPLRETHVLGQGMDLHLSAQRLLKNVSFSQGAAMGVPYGTAYRALFHKAGIRPGDWLLIQGATGGVGTAAVQLARSHGVKIIGTGGTEEGRKLVKKEGAHHVLDHHAADVPEQVAKITGGKGVDVILEMLANKNLAKDLPMLAKFGRVVSVGNRGTIEINPRDIMGRDAKILGMTMFNVSPEDLASIHAALVAGLENGSLRPIVGQEIPLAEAARAHEEVMKPSGAHGKIVLVT